MENKTIELELTLNEVNNVLEIIGEKSYKSVFMLIQKITLQAQSQLNEKQTENLTIEK